MSDATKVVALPAFDAAGGWLWLNRYGCLFDAKLDVIGIATHHAWLPRGASSRYG